MKYFDTKKDSLEEAISKAINEKPEQLKEARYEIKFGPNEYGQDDEDDYIDMLQGELEAKRIRVKVSPGSKNNTLSFDTNVPKAKLKKVIEDDLGYYVNESSEYYSNPNAKDLLEAGGKYLKYSDLLLQKGRMMAKGKNTAMIDKEISKEMKKLGIKEGSDEYEKFFQSALKKFKIDSPADLKTDDKKKEFFNYVDKNYKAKEEEVDLEEVNAKVIMDKDQDNRDLQNLLKKHKLKIKTLQKNVNGGYDEVEISGDKRDMEKMMKTTGDDSMYKFNPRTKEFELKEENLQEGMNADTAKAILKMRAKDKFEIFRGDYVPMIYLSNVDRKALKDAGHKMTQDIPKPTRGTTVTGILNVANGSSKSAERAGMYDTETDDMKGKNPAVINMKKFVKGDFQKIGYPKTVGDLVKMTGLRLNSNDPSKNNVDETLDKIREANIQKGKSMRSILADIWNMNEGKSPFEKDEGFASDAQRKAAFASGYKEKGKKGKKEEDEKSSKTMTGKKATKVEIEPEIK